MVFRILRIMISYLHAFVLIVRIMLYSPVRAFPILRNMFSAFFPILRNIPHYLYTLPIVHRVLRIARCSLVQHRRWYSTGAGAVPAPVQHRRRWSTGAGLRL